MKIGMYSVDPATSSRLSRLPAWRPGGLLLTRPISTAGATPMLPKNGFSGITIPGTNSDVIVLLSSWRILVPARLSQFAAHVARAAVVAVVDRQIDRQHLDLEHVPGHRAFHVHRAGEDVTAGTASRIALGNAATTALSEAWILSSATPARASVVGLLVSSVSTSMMSPEAIRSTGLVSDQ